MKSPSSKAMAVLGLIISAQAHAHAASVSITEIMYHPAAAKPEYFVVKNITQELIDISGWKAGQYVFPAGEYLQPSESVVISATDPAATRTAYQLPAQIRVAGPNPEVLANEGATISIRDSANAVVNQASYAPVAPWNDAWFYAADGTGHSLVVRHERFALDHRNWEPSVTNKCLNVAGAFAGKTTPVTFGSSWRYHVPLDHRHNFSNGRYLDFLDSGDWPTGNGLFGFETEPQNIPAPGIQTAVGSDSSQMVYQFRKTFDYSGDPAGARFVIDQIVDDGVRYYLNGELLGATRLPEKGSWREPGFGIPDAIEEVEALRGNARGLVQGTNVLLAEVHQWVVGSSDMVFGARLNLFPRPALRLSEIHFAANGTVDWVELQNTSNELVSANGLFVASRPDFTDKIPLSGSIAASGYSSWDVTLPDGRGSSSQAIVYLIDGNSNVLGTARVPFNPGAPASQAHWPSPTPGTHPVVHGEAVWMATSTSTRNAANASPTGLPILHSGEQGALYPFNRLVGQVQHWDISDSMEPDGGGLWFHWSVDPAIPGSFSLPDPGVLSSSFSVPGIFTLKGSISDNEGFSVTSIRQVMAYAAEDYDSLSGHTLKNFWNDHDWVNSEDTQGRTYQVINGHGLYMGSTVSTPMDSASIEDATITREIPQGDFAMQLTVSIYGQSNSMSGLYLKAREAEVRGHDYAFGIENGTHLVVRRLRLSGAAPIFSQPYSANEVTVRVWLDENRLRFQYFANGNWTTVITEDASNGIAAAGMLVAGTGPSAGFFKNAYLANPNNHPGSVTKNLRLTEIGPDYREFTNIGSGTLDLSRVSMNGAPFPAGLTLGAQQSVVITGNTAAYYQAHGTGIPVHQVQPDGFDYSNRNAPLYLTNASFPEQFVHFRPDLYPGLFSSSGTSVEIIDATGNEAFFHTAGNWRATSSPGTYQAFAPNFVDLFNAATLASEWIRHQWSPTPGGTRHYTLTEVPGALTLKIESSLEVRDYREASITRDISFTDGAIQTTVTRLGLNTFAGLGVLPTPNSGPQYLFGLTDSAQLRVQRPGDGPVLATLNYYDSSATLRVISAGGRLRFQTWIDEAWLTVWSTPAEEALREGGVFLIGAPGASASFTEVRITDPLNGLFNRLESIQLTEVSRDFYEITNLSGNAMDLTNLRIGDDGHYLPLPAGTVLQGGESLVIVENLTTFQQKYGTGIRAVVVPNVFIITSEAISLVETPWIYSNFYWANVTVPPGSFQTLERINPREEAGIGSNWRVITATPGVYASAAPPHLVLNTAGLDWDFTLDENAYFDASYSYDPENGPLSLHWTLTPANGAVMEDYAPAIKRTRFDKTGFYTLNLSVTDQDQQTSSTSRSISIAYPDDVETFRGGTFNPLIQVHNAVASVFEQNGINTYSLQRVTGKLLVDVDGVRALTRIGNDFSTAPVCFFRPLPGANGSVQAHVELPTSQYGYSATLAGLFVRTNGAAGNQYAVGINPNGVHIYRSDENENGGQFSLVFAGYGASPANLRVRATPQGLLFQRLENAVAAEGVEWTTMWVDPSASSLSDGGMFVASSEAGHHRALFDNFIVVDPEVRSRPKDYMKVTKFGPDFIELTNLGAHSMRLDGLFIRSGTDDWILPAMARLGSGESLLLVENAADFGARHGHNLRMLERPVLFPLGEQRPVAEFFLAENGGGGWFFRFTPADAPRGYAALEIKDPFSPPNYFNWKPAQTLPGRWAPDSDADGIPDAVETKFGSNPADPNSRALLALGSNGLNQPMLSWSSVNGQTYHVESCNNLGDPWTVVETRAGNGGAQSYTDTNATTARRFYRVTAP